MKIFIACDHAAFEAKEALKVFFMREKLQVVDLGTNSNESVHYPHFAIKLSHEVLKHPDYCGILLCGTGIGVSIVANKFKGIRAALCRSVEDAKLSREHNNANVLCLGARSNSIEELKKIIETWLNTSFVGGRHAERLNIFSDLGC